MKRWPDKKTSVLPVVDNSPYKKLSTSDIQVVPERSIVLEDMLQVAWVEVGRLKKKQSAGVSLDAKEVRTLTGLVESVTKLSKEQRENEKGFDPGSLTDEEYLEELKKATAALEKKIEAKNAKEGKE